MSSDDARVQAHLTRYATDFAEPERDANTKLLQHLFARGLCPYCCIRFINWQNIGLCAEPAALIRAVLAGAAGAAFPEPAGECPACLGVLPYAASDAFLESIYATITGSGYVYSSYLLTITTPPYLLATDAVLFAELRAAGLVRAEGAARPQHAYAPLPADPDAQPLRRQLEAVIPAKKLAKFAVGPRLTPRLGVPVDYQAPFRCEIELRVARALRLPPDFLQGLAKHTRRQIRGRAPDAVLGAEIQRLVYEGRDLTGFLDPAGPAGVSHAARVQREPAHVAGRYVKLQRGLAQTGEPPSDGEAEAGEAAAGDAPASVEALLEPLFRAEAAFGRFILTAAGREDADVRMLGDGRPALFQLHEPRDAAARDWAAAGAAISSAAAPAGVGLVGPLVYFEKSAELLQKLMRGSVEKRKRYRAVVFATEPLAEAALRARLAALRDVALEQRTPVRVLHRRPLAARRKTVHAAALVALLTERCFVLDLTASAGCYVKEFVHGDFGRTRPSLAALLGARALRIVQLDVAAVELPWP